MNSTTTTNHGSGNLIAFIFGAAFNVLANVNLAFLLDYMLQAIVGGIICLAFKIISDVLSPLWLKHKDRVRDFAQIKRSKKKSRLRSEGRNGKD